DDMSSGGGAPLGGHYPTLALSRFPASAAFRWCKPPQSTQGHRCGPRVRSSTAVLQEPYGGPLGRTLGRDTECSSAFQAEPRSSTLSSEKIPWRRALIGAHVRGRSQRSPRSARFLHHGSVITCLPK